MFANAFGMRLGDNDVTLTFGLNEGSDPKDMLEEVAVVMTPRTLKIMLNHMGNALKALEAKVGEIPTPPGKLHPSFDEMIKTGMADIDSAEKATVKKLKK